MQYIYRTLYIVITLLLLASCESNDNLLKEQESVNVLFTATLPQELQTRSYGNGEQVDILYVGIFDEEGLELLRKTSPIESSIIDFSISLAKNQTYDIVFWAQHEAGNMYDIDDMKSIKMRTTAIMTDFAMIEQLDAFYATENITTTRSSIHTVELVRPLAQVNVGTSGKQAANATFKIVGAPTTFNPFIKEVNGAEDLTFTYNDVTDERFEVKDVEYNYLAIGYLFAPMEEDKILECELELNELEESESIKHTFPEVYFRSNKRTNIVGTFTNE